MAGQKRVVSKERRPRKARRAHSSQQPQEAAQPSPEQPEAAGEKGFLFDPYWDEMFAAYYDPMLRTCCRIR
jgi:hypothetical protein